MTEIFRQPCITFANAKLFNGDPLEWEDVCALYGYTDTIKSNNKDVEFKNSLYVSCSLMSSLSLYIPKNLKGLYFLADSNSHIVYIGISKCLNSRLKNHYYDESKEFSYFFIFPTDGLMKYDNVYLVEKDLIKLHRPKYNVTHNLNRET